MKVVNKKAKFEYEILKTYVCGIVLFGSEVKAFRQCKCNIADSYCYINNNEVWMKNSYIGKYDSDIFTSHEERRERKLLLNKYEIRKIKQKIQVEGITLIPLKMFINDRGLIKIEIGVCKGKKIYDKRNDIKDRENKIELNRINKSY